MPNPRKYLLTRSIMDGGFIIIRWLGSPGLVGLAMMEAHFEGMPWRTAKQLGERAECSDDTARRQADNLVNINRALCRTVNGRRLYAIRPEVAELIVKEIEGRFTLAA